MVQQGNVCAKSKRLSNKCAGVEDIYHAAQQGILVRLPVKFSLLCDFCS